MKVQVKSKAETNLGSVGTNLEASLDTLKTKLKPVKVQTGPTETKLKPGEVQTGTKVVPAASSADVSSTAESVLSCCCRRTDQSMS